MSRRKKTPKLPVLTGVRPEADKSARAKADAAVQSGGPGNLFVANANVGAPGIKSGLSPAGDEAKTPREGPECRDCGCHWLPVDRTKRTGNWILRYRHCHHCGKRMTTIEKIV